MKILAIGDPHGDLKKVQKIPLKNIDLILLTGDIGKADLMRKIAFENIERGKAGLEEKEFPLDQKKKAHMEAYESSMRIVKYLARHAPVYTIFGNVEMHNKEVRDLSNKINLDLPFLYNDLNAIDNVRVINNRIASFKGIRIGGLEYFIDTNWVKEFKPDQYKERMKNAKKETDKAKQVLKWFDGLDILVCHQPPYGYLDKVTAKFAPRHWQGKHAGSKTILNYIKKHKPKYVFCGHIHEGEGMKKLGNTETYNLGIAGYRIIGINKD